MSNGTIAIVAVVTVAVGGVGYVLYQQHQRKIAVAQANARAAAAANAAKDTPEKKLSLGDALSTLGGKALTEGAKYLALGPQGYVAASAANQQRAT